MSLHNLRTRLLGHFKTQQNFANMMGKNRKTIYIWLNRNPMPIVKHVDRICNITKIPKNELLDLIIKAKLL